MFSVNLEKDFAENEDVERDSDAQTTDPRYAPFFRLKALGVPVAQLQQRMRFEGLDPEELLKNGYVRC